MLQIPYEDEGTFLSDVSEDTENNYLLSQKSSEKYQKLNSFVLINTCE